jgi:hypothetical protein
MLESGLSLGVFERQQSGRPILKSEHVSVAPIIASIALSIFVICAMIRGLRQSDDVVMMPHVSPSYSQRRLDSATAATSADNCAPCVVFIDRI